MKTKNTVFYKTKMSNVFFCCFLKKNLSACVVHLLPWNVVVVLVL